MSTKPNPKNQVRVPEKRLPTEASVVPPASYLWAAAWWLGFFIMASWIHANPTGLLYYAPDFVKEAGPALLLFGWLYFFLLLVRVHAGSSQQWGLSEQLFSVLLFLWLLFAWVGLGFPSEKAWLITPWWVGVLVLFAIGLRGGTWWVGAPTYLPASTEHMGRFVLPFVLCALAIPALLLGASVLYAFAHYVCLGIGILFLLSHTGKRILRAYPITWLGVVFLSLAPMFLSPFHVINGISFAEKKNRVWAQMIRHDPRLTLKQKFSLLHPLRYDDSIKKEVGVELLRLWSQHPDSKWLTPSMIGAISQSALGSFFQQHPTLKGRYVKTLLRLLSNTKVSYADSHAGLCQAYKLFPGQQPLLRERFREMVLFGYISDKIRLRGTLVFPGGDTYQYQLHELIMMLRGQLLGHSGNHYHLKFLIKGCLGQTPVERYTTSFMSPNTTFPGTLGSLVWVFVGHQLSTPYNSSFLKAHRGRLTSFLKRQLQSQKPLVVARGMALLHELCDVASYDQNELGMCHEVLSAASTPSGTLLAGARHDAVRIFLLMLSYLKAKGASEREVIQKTIRSLAKPKWKDFVGQWFSHMENALAFIKKQKLAVRPRPATVPTSRPVTKTPARWPALQPGHKHQPTSTPTSTPTSAPTSRASSSRPSR